MKLSENSRSVISGPQITRRLIAWNSVLNLAGQVLPLAVGLFAVPLLIAMLGTERFGLLAIVWIVIGYFGLFDFGLGRTITKLIADKLGSGDEQDITELVWTALLIMLGMGVVLCVVALTITDWLIADVLNIPVELESEAGIALYYLALTIPLLIVSIGLRGVLEAFQRFPLITVVRIPVGIWNFVGPIIAAKFGGDLQHIVLTLCVGRLLSTFVFIFACFHIVSLPRLANISRSAAKSVLTFGSWLAISNIAGPLTVFMDRFLVAGMLSMSAVAYYSTPHQIITRLLIVPAAILGVMFPIFATQVQQSVETAYRSYTSSVKHVLLLLAPAVIVIVLFAEPLISIWINSEFAEKSHWVARLLAIGVFINSIGIVSQTYIQGIGRPDLTAKFSLIELPIYTGYLYAMIKDFGIEGAAVSWLIRVTISTILLALMASRVSARMRSTKVNRIATSNEPTN